MSFSPHLGESTKFDSRNARPRSRAKKKAMGKHVKVLVALVYGVILVLLGDARMEKLDHAMWYLAGNGIVRDMMLSGNSFVKGEIMTPKVHNPSKRKKKSKRRIL